MISCGEMPQLQTVEKVGLPQARICKRKNEMVTEVSENGKGFSMKPLPLLAFPDFEHCGTGVRQRTQNRKIYLPFSTSASVSIVYRHAEAVAKYHSLFYALNKLSFVCTVGIYIFLHLWLINSKDIFFEMCHKMTVEFCRGV